MYSIPFPLLNRPNVDKTILLLRCSFVLKVSCGTNGTLGIPCGTKKSLFLSIS